MSDFRIDVTLPDLGDLALQCEEAARPAAQAGAEVIYRRVKANVQQLGRVTGNLDRSIYQAFSASKSTRGRPEYHVGWNSKRGGAHGHLLEFGYIQRYVIYVGRDGNWYTAKRPESKGKPKPKRKASQAVKDRYYVPLKGGPRMVAAKPFLRPAAAAFPAAIEAMRARWLEELQKRGVTR